MSLTLFPSEREPEDFVISTKKGDIHTTPDEPNAYARGRTIYIVQRVTVVEVRQKDVEDSKTGETHTRHETICATDYARVVSEADGERLLHPAKLEAVPA